MCEHGETWLHLEADWEQLEKGLCRRPRCRKGGWLVYRLRPKGTQELRGMNLLGREVRQELGERGLENTL